MLSTYYYVSDIVIGIEDNDVATDDHDDVFVVVCERKLMTNKFTVHSMTFTLFTQANFRFFQI